MNEARSTDKSARFCRRWQKHRKLGAFCFVIVWGVLGWGVTMLALVYIGLPWLLGVDIAWPAFTDIVICLFLGLLGGLHMWHVMETRYAEECKEKK